MEKFFAICAALLITAGVLAQAPEKMSYQAVVRDPSNGLVKSTSVGMQITLLQGSASGTAVYVEIQTPITNVNGLVSIEIGTGTTNDDFSTIDWANGPYFIKTETDPAGGTNYTITGISQLLSVPYALHAKTAESVKGGLSETDPIFTSSQAANITVSDITNLGNLSGTNTGDQDLSGLATKAELGDSTAQIRSEMPDVSGIATNTQAIQDTAAQIRADIPTNNNQLINGAGYLTSYTETDPSVPKGNQTGEMQYWNGRAWVIVAAGNEGQFLTFNNGEPVWVTLAGATTVGPTDVYNPTTGKVWMDRNLGALQVATSITDTAAFGDLYQWGRAADGHESRTSGTTSNLSSNDTPGHGDFIIVTGNSDPYDWRSPQNDNLWQGVNGTNNPCPSGYRLPTAAEWEAERASWSSINSAGAFASPLKLPMAGSRSANLGLLSNVGSSGFYWSSTVDGVYSWVLRFENTPILYNLSNIRAAGHSVRCIKE